MGAAIAMAIGGGGGSSALAQRGPDHGQRSSAAAAPEPVPPRDPGSHAPPQATNSPAGLRPDRGAIASPLPAGLGPASISGASPAEHPSPPLAPALATEAATGAEPVAASGGSALPLLSYAPETHLAFGGFGVYYFRIGDAPADSRPSYIAGAAIYTTRLQTLIDLYPDFWFGNERFHLASVANVRDFPDSFFGIGSHTRAADEERYRFQGVREQVDATVRTVGRLYAGVRQEAQWYHVADPRVGGALEQHTVLGSEGGWRSGIGATLTWDSRDSALSARRGGYYHASITTFQHALGSEYAYTRFNVDLRQFVPLGGDHTLALQLYGDLNAGNIPFQHLALLGGQYRLRGHFEGRFRDKNYLLAQAEYRTPIFLWRFGFVAFAAAGVVAPRVDAFAPADIKWAAGAGVRFALDVRERIHLRADFGAGPDTWGLYVNVLEAF